MMSRKHYVTVASILAYELADAEHDGPTTLAVTRVARELAGMFKADNTNFDRQRFYSAVGV